MRTCTQTEIKNTGHMVRDILRSDRHARNSDKYLIFRVYQIILGGRANDGYITITLFDLDRLPSAETIIRARAKIQNDEKMFLAEDPKVRITRKIREEDFRIWAQTNF